jgi:TonB family protein
MKTSPKYSSSCRRSFFVFFLFCSVLAFSKGPKFVYYDSDFYTVNKKENAAYYAIINPNEENGREHKCYYITGELYWEGTKSHIDNNTLDEDIKEGISTWYFKNGNKKEQASYLHNLENGDYISYLENGSKRSDQKYNDDKLDGPSIFYYESGSIKAKKYYEEGLINGLSIFYYENGNIEEKEYFKEGKEIGDDSAWYATGELWWVAHYIDGKRTGQSFVWYENHKVKWSWNYKNGKLHGKQFSYFKTDSLESVDEYNDGKQVGKFVIYWENNKLKRQELHEDDSLIAGKCYDTTGHEIAFYKYAEMPVFPGGESALMTFLRMHIHYPASAVENDIQGRVIVDFVVDKNGKIQDVNISKGVYPSLDKEAIRVVKSMPDWIPGKQDGNTVNVSYKVPIKFTLH